MASGGADRVVRLWDPVEGRQTGTLMGMTDTVTEVAFTGGDARALIAAGSDQALRMFNLETGRVRHTLTGHSAKVSLTWSGSRFRAGMTWSSTGKSRPLPNLVLIEMQPRKQHSKGGVTWLSVCTFRAA